MAQEEAQRKQRLEAFSDHALIFFFLSYIFYPTLSLLQFEGLICQEFEDGEVQLLQVRGCGVRVLTTQIRAPPPPPSPPHRQPNLNSVALCDDG